jgi:hypothetical protein
VMPHLIFTLLPLYLALSLKILVFFIY